jgi:hypothetical protein
MTDRSRLCSISALQLKIVVHTRWAAQEAAVQVKTGHRPNSPDLVIPRAGGGSSTPRIIGSITAVSGILDRPPSRTMTAEYEATISRRVASEFCIVCCPLEEMRAQGRPGARCTRGPACDLRKQKCTRAYRYRRSIPAFPAQWLYGLLRALPGERLFCLRRYAEISAQLNASTAAPEPHDFAVRIRRVRLSRHQRPPHPTARS